MGRRSEVRSIVQALGLLGSDRLYALIVTSSFKRLSARLANWPVAKRWWRHSLATALLAADISSEYFGDMTEEYTSGLLHDLGRLILLASAPQEYSDLVDRAASLHQDGRDLERELFGSTHEEVGGQAMKQFGFPASLIALTTHHHDANLALPEFRPTASLMGSCCHTASMCGFDVIQLSENTKESEESDDLDLYLKERMYEIEAGLPAAA
jgi:HD-like signal output (HDOD) protein